MSVMLTEVWCTQAGQDFSPTDRSVLNKGELLGSQVVVTAQGTYEPQVIVFNTLSRI